MTEFGVMGVVHSVAFGMSGSEQLSGYKDLIEKVNVQGVRNSIRASVANKVQAFGKRKWHIILRLG